MRLPSLPVRMDRRTPLIFVLGLAVVFAAWWFFARPATAQLEEELNKQSSMQAQVDKLNASVQARLAGGEDTLGTLFSQVQTADTLLPQSVDVSSLVTEIPASVSASGLTLVSLDPAAAAAPGAGGLSSSSYTVVASGSYANITSWLASIQQDPELKTVTGVSVTSGSSQEDGASEGGFTVNLTLNVWSSSTPALLPQATTNGTQAPPSTVSPGAVPTIPAGDPDVNSLIPEGGAPGSSGITLKPPGG